MDSEMLIFLVVVLFVMAVFCLFIGGKVLFSKKPMLFSSRLLLAFVALGFSPVIIINIMGLIKHRNSGAGSAGPLIIIFMFLGILVFKFIMLKGYSAIGITGKSFRDALIYSLEKNNLEYKEELSSIILTKSGVQFQVAIQDWIGSGMLKIKKNDSDFKLDKIVDGMKTYYAENSTKTNNITSWLYIFLGSILLVMSVIMISVKLNHRARSHYQAPAINVSVK